MSPTQFQFERFAEVCFAKVLRTSRRELDHDRRLGPSIPLVDGPSGGHKRDPNIRVLIGRLLKREPCRCFLGSMCEMTFTNVKSES